MTNIEVKTRSIMDSLNNSERKVATYFLNNIESIFSSPIAQLAKESGVSQVTWIRFCKAIGFDGLKDLKRNLFQELNNTSEETAAPHDFSDIKQYSTIEQMCNTIKSTTIQAVEDTMTLIDTESLSKIVELISNAKCVKLFGAGASALVANDFYNKLLRINKNACFSYDTHTQLTYGANTGPDEISLIFSYSGNTKEMLEILSMAKKSKCPTVAITKYTKSPLIADSDYAIYLSAPEIDHRSGAMSSRVAQLTVVDLLFTCLANKNYNDVEKYLEESYEVCRKHKM
ncbi:MurR/RpiR family transcriptional regulator [Vallitalea okinawensis]|uniref:MurR/RpiR family transcriptional regulator n=1 Tax=Vallitalea okinawensis TaxID=2078660 RepID=UPI000CFB92CC|nr:MurR/RpiR family transcriptional regulator [Vallitalea okinawensis]